MEIPKIISNHHTQLLLAAFVLLGITWRLVPHIPNFAPVGAIAVIVGMMLGWRKSLLAVAAIMLVSDLVIGLYPGFVWTWLGFGLIGGVGYAAKTLPALWRVPAGAVGASLVFFVASNFGTWIASGMYSLDLAGLVECYVMALPFFKATMASDLLFSGLLLCAYELTMSYRNATIVKPKAIAI